MVNRKQKVYITLSPELVHKAREIGLNISKVCENALIDMINRLESPIADEKGGRGTVGSRGAGSGTRTHEGLRHRSLSPAP